jgi:hypothetical protein
MILCHPLRKQRSPLVTAVERKFTVKYGKLRMKFGMTEILSHLPSFYLLLTHVIVYYGKKWKKVVKGNK